MNDPIEAYLNELRAAACTRVGAARLIEDCAEHLRDSQDDLIAQGVEPDAAAELAVERFGEATLIVGLMPRLGGSLWRQMATALSPIVTVGLVAMGVGGLVAALVGDPTGDHATQTMCQIAAGVVGMSVLEMRRRQHLSGRSFSTPALPRRALAIVALSTFMVASAVAVSYAAALIWWGRSHQSPGPLTTGLLLLAAAWWAALKPKGEFGHHDVA